MSTVIDTTDLLRADLAREALRELIPYFKGRKFRSSDRSGDKFPCWNIKVYSPNLSGHSGPELLLSEYDVLWERWVEKNDEFFSQCCEDGLLWIEDSWYTGNKEIDKCGHIIEQSGRSGGWLLLKSFDKQATDYYSVTNSDFIPEHFIDRSNPEDMDIGIDMNAIEDIWSHIGWLKKLQVFCESLDKFDATEEWNYECNFRRSEKEYEWKGGDLSDFGEEDLIEFLDNQKIPKNVRKQIKAYLTTDITSRLNEIAKKGE